MRVSVFSCLLLLLTSSSTLASTKARSKPQDAAAAGNMARTPAQVHQKSSAGALRSIKRSVTHRRPLVNAGLRYSTNDWFLNLLTIPFSYILRRISGHLFCNLLAGLATIYLRETYYPELAIPMTGHSLVASSLGLLLSYRTNSAYARFWEARGVWTSTKSICRNMALTVKTHLEPTSPRAARKLMQQIAEFPYCLMHLCLGGGAQLPASAAVLMPIVPMSFKEQPAWPAMLLVGEMQKTLLEAEHENKRCQGRLVEAAHLVHLCHEVEHLLGCMCKCEKILRTPVPWTYSRHTSRFLSLWLMSLPMALVGTVNKWMALGIAMTCAYCMLGIEEIGHLIEQPFVGDPLSGDDKIYVSLDEDGEAPEIMTRGKKTLPYDIGIPVCSLAQQIKKEVQEIAAIKKRGKYFPGYGTFNEAEMM